MAEPQEMRTALARTHLLTGALYLTALEPRLIVELVVIVVVIVIVTVTVARPDAALPAEASSASVRLVRVLQA